MFIAVCLGKSSLGCIAHVCSPYEGESQSKGREGSSVGVFGRKRGAGERDSQNLMFTLSSPKSFLSQTSSCASSDPDKHESAPTTRRSLRFFLKNFCVCDILRKCPSSVGTEQPLKENVLGWPLADGKFKATVEEEAAFQ